MSAAIRIRLATRSAGIDGMADGGPPDASGGSVIRGAAVASAVAVGLGDGVASGTAATGSVKERRPTARNVTPSAVRMAGTILVRSQIRRSAMGAAW